MLPNQTNLGREGVVFCVRSSIHRSDTFIGQSGCTKKDSNGAFHENGKRPITLVIPQEILDECSRYGLC